MMREEGMVLPPGLRLIFKALVTVDGVLPGISPEFDLSAAMQRSALHIAQSRLAREYWGPILQALPWDILKVGEDARSSYGRLCGAWKRIPLRRFTR